MKKLIIILLLCINIRAFGQFFAPNQKPCLGLQVNWAKPITRGLVGYWPFNEGAGSKVFDFSGNGNTGSFNGDVSWTAGPSGCCLTFPGSDDWIDISDDRLPAFGTGDFTIVAKVKHPQDDTHRVILSKGGTGDGEFIFYKTSGDVPRFYGDSGGISAAWGGPNSWPDNDWVQFAITRQGSTLQTYLNAVAGGSDATAGADLNSGVDWRIGATDDGTLDWVGEIDFIYVYNRALSSSEITKLYREPFCLFQPSWNLSLYGAISAPVAGGQVIIINN